MPRNPPHTPHPRKPSDSLTQVRDDERARTIKNASPLSQRFSQPLSPPSQPGDVTEEVPQDVLDDDRFSTRYELKTRLGEGGMGVVALAEDRRIGREIAMKVARPDKGSFGDAKSRFLREARVQGQLEHPAIVPVYDLGRDPSGTEYFTMKRVRGMTLEDVLFRLRSGSPSATKQYSRRKLLTAFGSVCLAMHFAHTRGVLHRDLKPANIMLGDYGEVYVLDWGIAKLRGPSADVTYHPESNAVPDPEHVLRGGDTIQGELMGTPGYMSPEQARGEFDAMEARSDVYALGAILFEILTLETLHPQDDVDAALASTRAGTEARFAAGIPETLLPPELEEVCRKATALAPEDRFESARELSESVWRYLDGDRDLERRVALAAEHAEAAARAADRALEGGASQTEDRQLAMAEVSRALALDPNQPEALRVLVRLLTELPRELPPEALHAIDASAQRTMRVSTRAAAFAYLSWALYVPLLLWMGVRDWAAAGVVGILWSTTMIAGLWTSRNGHPTGNARYVVILMSTLAIGATTTIFGPFMLLPGMAAINASMLVLNFERALRVATMILSCLAVAVPAALSALGVLPSPYAFRDGVMVISPQMVSLPAGPTTVFLLAANLAIIVTSCLMISRVRESLSQAERRLHLQAWQLRQLVPHEAQFAASNAPTTIARLFIGKK